MEIVVIMVIFQGLLETYYLLGEKCHKNLKDFVEKIKDGHDILKIIIENRENKKISIPRKIINDFRQFILDIGYFDEDEDTQEVRKNISGGIIEDEKKSISSEYYINELVLSAITEIFKIPLIFVLKEGMNKLKK